MADNFEKLQSMYATLRDGTTNVQLPDADRGTLLAPLVDGRPSRQLGQDLQILTESGKPDFTGAGSVTYNKILSQTERDKTTIGSGTIEATKTKPVTVRWNKPKYFNIGATAWDIKRGLDYSFAKSASKNENDHTIRNEKAIFVEIQGKIPTANKVVVDYMATGMTALQIRQDLIQRATKLTLTVDDDNGINGIPAQYVKIQVRSDVFDKMADAGLAGNFVQQIFLNGKYAVSTIGKYEISVNDYLPVNVEACIFATYSWATETDYLANNVTPKYLGSNDIQLYQEIAELSGAINENLIVMVSSV